MTHKEREEQINCFLQKAAELREVKGHDYTSGDDVMENFRMDGWYGCLVRLQDKVCRMRAFHMKGKFLVKEEFLDTAMDAVNYILFTYLLFDESKRRETVEGIHDFIPPEDRLDLAGVLARDSLLEEMCESEKHSLRPPEARKE